MNVIVAVFVTALFALTGVAHGAEVTAKKITDTEAPKIDGKVDKIWDSVRATKIPVAEGKIGKIEVTMKVLYTDKDLYFLFQWSDETESLGRYYEFDGKAWKKAKGDQDRFAIMWDIHNTVKDFPARGCTALCHQKGKEVFQNTDSPSERMDIWHWQAQLTNLLGYADDMYLGHELKEGAKSAQWQDAKTAGGNEANWDEGAKHPKYTFKEGVKPDPVLPKKDALKVQDYGELKAGARLPMEVVERPHGSAGDVEAKGAWEKGGLVAVSRWTLEIRRARVTEDKENDIQFTDPARAYPFGIAVHDNVGGSDHSHTGKTGHKLLLK